MNQILSVIKPAALGLALILTLTSCGGHGSTGSGLESSGSELSDISLESEGFESSLESDPNGETSEIAAPSSPASASNVSSKTGSSSTSVDSATTSSTASSTPSISETLGINAALKTYCGASDGPARITKELLLPCVAYMDGDQIKDTMFDAFVFLPSPNWVYDWGSEDGGKAAHKKSDWLKYVTSYEFANGYNMDALEEAVGEVKQVLGRSDYKPGVFMSLFCPVKRVTSFGEVDGRNLNFSNLEDRKAAVKWMVDESIRQFKAKNYKNLKINGFYWFHEGMDYKDMESLDVIKYVTDYVRSLGYITIWSPFFTASGYNRWADYGFDMATMQANYFAGGSPNAGGEDRLYQVAESKRKYGLGVEIELEDVKEINITVTKKYLKYGVELGYMNNYNLYYMGGPGSVHTICRSKNEYFRSLYDEMYRFVKRTLKAGDIILK